MAEPIESPVLRNISSEDDLPRLPDPVLRRRADHDENTNINSSQENTLPAGVISVDNKDSSVQHDTPHANKYVVAHAQNLASPTRDINEDWLRRIRYVIQAATKDNVKIHGVVECKEGDTGDSACSYKFLCNFCDTYFHSHKDLLVHMEKHIFVCSFCGEYRSFQRMKVIIHSLESHASAADRCSNIRTLKYDLDSLNRNTDSAEITDIDNIVKLQPLCLELSEQVGTSQLSQQTNQVQSTPRCITEHTLCVSHCSISFKEESGGKTSLLDTNHSGSVDYSQSTLCMGGDSEMLEFPSTQDHMSSCQSVNLAEYIDIIPSAQDAHGQTLKSEADAHSYSSLASVSTHPPSQEVGQTEISEPTAKIYQQAKSGGDNEDLKHTLSLDLQSSNIFPGSVLLDDELFTCGVIHNKVNANTEMPVTDVSGSVLEGRERETIEPGALSQNLESAAGIRSHNQLPACFVILENITGTPYMPANVTDRVNLNVAAGQLQVSPPIANTITHAEPFRNGHTQSAPRTGHQDLMDVISAGSTSDLETSVTSAQENMASTGNEGGDGNLRQYGVKESDAEEGQGSRDDGNLRQYGVEGSDAEEGKGSRDDGNLRQYGAEGSGVEQGQGSRDALPCVLACYHCSKPGKTMFAIKNHIKRCHQGRSVIVKDMKQHARRLKALHYLCAKCPYSTQDKSEFNNHAHTKSIDIKTPLSIRDVRCHPKEKSHENGEHRCSEALESKNARLENEVASPKDQNPDSSKSMKNKAEQPSLADIWMRNFNKTESRLEITFPSPDEIRNVYRVDIAQVWKVASYLTKSKGKFYVCDVCGYMSCSRDHVHEHIGITHLGLSTWICPYCSFKKRNRMALVDHLKSVHSGLDWFVIRFREYRSGGFRDTIESAVIDLPPFPLLDEDHVKSYAMVAKERYTKSYMSKTSFQNREKAHTKKICKVKNKRKAPRYKCNVCNNLFESVMKCKHHCHNTHRHEQKETPGIGLVAIVLDMANRCRFYCCPIETCSYVSSKKYLVTLHKLRGCQDKKRSYNFRCYYCNTTGYSLLSIKRHCKKLHAGLAIIAQSIVSRAMGRRSMHYMCSKCPFRCQRRTEFNCHTKTHRLKLSTQRLRRLEGRPDYLASPSTLNIDAYSANLQSASEGTASVCNPTNAAIRLDNEAIANRNTGPKSTMLEQPSVMKPDERNALTAERGDSLLGDMWLQAANKCDSSLEIALPSRDAIRSVYRPDIAEIWKVADKLVVSVQGTKKCSICPYKSATPLQCIEEHVGAIHLGIKRWLCSLCAYNDNKRVHIIEHIQTQHAGKKCSAILCKNIYKSTYNGILDNSAQNLQFRRLGDVEAYVLAKHIKENTGQLSKVFQALKERALDTLLNQVIRTFNTKETHDSGVKKGNTNKKCSKDTARIRNYKCFYCASKFGSRVGAKKHILKIHPGKKIMVHNVWVSGTQKTRPRQWQSGQQHLKSCRKLKAVSSAVASNDSTGKQNSRTKVPNDESGDMERINDGSYSAEKAAGEHGVTVDDQKKSSVEYLSPGTSKSGHVVCGNHGKTNKTSSSTSRSQIKVRTMSPNLAVGKKLQDKNATEADTRRPLGDFWMERTTRMDPSLEIEIGSSDGVKNVYRPDIAQLWYVADKLLRRAGKKYKCSMCKFKSEVKTHVREHIGRTHLHLTEWMCPYCPFQNGRRPPVVSHLKTSHEGEDFYLICCRTYRYKEVTKAISTSSTKLAAYCRITKGGIRHLAKFLLDNDGLLGSGSSLDASSNRRPLFECTRCSLSSPSFDDLFNHLSVHDGISVSTTTQQQPASTSQAKDTIQDPADNQPAIVLLSSDSESDNDDLHGFQVDLEDSPDEDCVVID